MNIRRLNIDHLFIHVLFQAIAGIIYGFGVFMLLKRGYSSADAGIAMAIANFLSIVLQPIISNYLDNNKKFTVFEVSIICSLIVCVSYLFNSLLNTKSFALTVIFILCFGIYASMEPLFNSLATVFKHHDFNIDFNKARALGSLSYGFICTVFGFLSEEYGYLIVTLAGFVFSLLLSLICIKTRSDFYTLKSKDIKIEKEETISFKDFIKTNTNYIILCIFLTGIFVAYTCVDNFYLIIIENVGGSASDMGVILGIKAAIEFVGMIIIGILINKKYKLTSLLKVSGIGFVLKCLIVTLSNNVLGIYLAQIFQIISFAFIVPGMVNLIETTMKKNEIMRANAFFTMTISLGAVISSLVGGLISDAYNVKIMLIVTLVISIISSLGFMYFIDKQKGVQE